MSRAGIPILMFKGVLSLTQQRNAAGTLFWLFLLISPLLDLINGIRGA